MPHSFSPKKIHLDQKGLEKVLGSLEAAVMEVMWIKPSQTIRCVRDALAPKKDVAFNTVMTVMNRMVDKGLLKQLTSGGATCYTPTCTRGEFLQKVSHSVFASFLQDTRIFGVAFFHKAIRELDEESRASLRRVLDEI
ncbi:MAG: BlaI/MecI/CopY family transcriptional regulator [Patescibacteria group bacterium]